MTFHEYYKINGFSNNVHATKMIWFGRDKSSGICVHLLRLCSNVLYYALACKIYVFTAEMTHYERGAWTSAWQCVCKNCEKKREICENEWKKRGPKPKKKTRNIKEKHFWINTKPSTWNQINIQWNWIFISQLIRVKPKHLYMWMSFLYLSDFWFVICLQFFFSFFVPHVFFFPFYNRVENRLKSCYSQYS